MSETIHVAVHATGSDSCRVTVAGELDVATAADVRTALQRRWSQGDVERAVLPLNAREHLAEAIDAVASLASYRAAMR